MPYNPPQPPQAPEVTTAQYGVADGALGTVQVTPTQVRRPWRATARTTFQALVALAVLFPVLVDATGLKVEDWPFLGIALGVAAAVAKVMALPQVEVFLRRFIPFLSAAPKE